MKIRKSNLRYQIIFFLLGVLTLSSHFFLMNGSLCARTNIIMLDPAGDARQRGRVLCNGYERGETLKCAEAMKQALTKRWDGEVIVARTLGEEKLPLQVPMFANRLHVDLLLHISMYHESTLSKPRVHFYQLVYNPLFDFAPRSYDPLAFIPLDQAHFGNVHTTKFMGTVMRDFLQQNHAKLMDASGPYGIPLRSLVGVTSPALIIELGLHDDDQWESLVSALVESVLFVLKK